MADDFHPWVKWAKPNEIAKAAGEIAQQGSLNTAPCDLLADTGQHRHDNPPHALNGISGHDKMQYTRPDTRPLFNRASPAWPHHCDGGNQHDNTRHDREKGRPCSWKELNRFHVGHHQRYGRERYERERRRFKMTQPVWQRPFRVAKLHPPTHHHDRNKQPKVAEVYPTR